MNRFLVLSFAPRTQSASPSASPPPHSGPTPRRMSVTRLTSQIQDEIEGIVEMRT